MHDKFTHAASLSSLYRTVYIITRVTLPALGSWPGREMCTFVHKSSSCRIDSYRMSFEKFSDGGEFCTTLSVNGMLKKRVFGSKKAVLNTGKFVRNDSTRDGTRNAFGSKKLSKTIIVLSGLFYADNVSKHRLNSLTLGGFYA